MVSFKKINYKKLAISLALPLLAGVIGSFFTAKSIPAWYATLAKPSFSPPNWVFAPVWTTLYVLMGVALYLVWMKGIGKPGVRHAVWIFGIQLALNAAWSVIFFGMRNPFVAFVELIVMWCFIVATTEVFYRIEKTAAYLMIPYILWVSFAAVLNFAIWRLN